MIEVLQIPVLVDNFIYILHEEGSSSVVVVDPSMPRPVLELLEKRKWTLSQIWNTHHHPDHVGGNLELKRQTGCKIIGAKKDKARIPGIDIELADGDTFSFAKEPVNVLSVDGHTVGHIAYWLPQSAFLFCGDTIFSLGCGKLFEGNPQQMWSSLEKLRSLPEETKIYCSHEYTLENSKFALSIEPKNEALQARVHEARMQRMQNTFTVPTTLQEELATNPFLRPESEEIKKNLSLAGKENWEIFAALRAAKDRMDSES